MPKLSKKKLSNIIKETGNAQEDYKIWNSRLLSIENYRVNRPVNNLKDWQKYYKWYMGEHYNYRDNSSRLSADNPRGTATVNITGATVNSYVPFLINGDIEFLLRPKKPGDEISAAIQTGLLNYEWNERNMSYQLKKSVRDGVIIGHGVIRIDYTLEVDDSINPEEFGEIRYEDYVRKDAPYIRRVNPLHFLFDLSGRDGDLNTARWCAEIFYIPYEDVITNATYNKEAIAKIISEGCVIKKSYDVSTTTPKVFPINNQFGNEPPEHNLVELVEIWDKKYRKRIIYARNVEIPLIEEVWPYPYLDNFPYEIFNFIEVPNDPYPLGIVRWGEDQQLQLDLIRTMQFWHINSHKRLFQVEAGGMNPDEVEKWETLPDGGLVTITQGGRGIIPIPDAPMSQDIQLTEARIKDDYQMVTGSDELIQGRGLGSRTTAGEIATRANIFGKKLDVIIQNVEQFTTNIGIQVLHHLKKNRVVKDVVKIVGKQGEDWKEYTNEEIQADTDVTVIPFSAPKIDPAILQQQKLQILQLVTQAMPVLQNTNSANQVDYPALLEWVLESFDEEDIGRFFIPARVVNEPIEEINPEDQISAGQGLPPQMAGTTSTQPISNEPQNPNPEQINIQDLMRQIQQGGLV